MKTKKTEPQIENFTKGVDSLGTELLNNNGGYVLFAYNELGEKEQENAFASNGKLNNIAECMYACMKANPMLANVVIAASNAIMQNRMLEAQMNAEQPVATDGAKGAGKKKSKKVVS